MNSKQRRRQNRKEASQKSQQSNASSKDNEFTQDFMARLRAKNKLFDVTKMIDLPWDLMSFVAFYVDKPCQVMYVSYEDRKYHTNKIVDQGSSYFIQIQPICLEITTITEFVAFIDEHVVNNKEYLSAVQEYLLQKRARQLTLNEVRKLNHAQHEYEETCWDCWKGPYEQKIQDYYTYDQLTCDVQLVSIE